MTPPNDKIQPLSEGMKTVVVQASHLPSGSNIDPNLQSIMDSLQLSDSNVYRILRGEIEELMDTLAQEIVRFRQQAEVYNNHYTTMNQIQSTAMLNQLIAHQDAMFEEVNRIRKELAHYYNAVPYLLMLSPLKWLSNLSSKQVRDNAFMQSIMIQRDRCLRDNDCDDSFNDDNNLDAIEILMHDMNAGSEKGWKSNVIRNEVREQRTVIEDHTHSGQPEKKGWKSRLGL